MLTEHKFETREAASVAAAARMAGLLGAQLSEAGNASFAVSGGTTPGKCFDYLSDYDLDWSRVRVFLSDERWVGSGHADSNERLVRETLLKGGASAGQIQPVYEEGADPAARAEALQAEQPAEGFACALVGMGTDGHFASLFPDADNLAEGLRQDSTRFYLPVTTTASPHPRISMTLSALLNSKEILLLIFGEEKLAVFDNAHTVDKTYPVTALLEQQQTPVSLYWAP